jgi:glycosyltransferase involved in cell wall biosynthesis
MNISVCMATYNGARYVHEQVASILPQLGPSDELVVVDDCSRDETTRVLRAVADPRVRIHLNESNRGVVASFEIAMLMARNEVLMLADQDDVWLEGRVQALVAALQSSGALVVSSNSSFMDADGAPIRFDFPRLRAEDSARHWRNIARIFAGNAPYWGCAMALRRSMLGLVLPMPRWVESHDLWIAAASNLIGSNVHVERDTLRRRVHGSNASIVSRSLWLKLRSRVIFARSMLVLAWRARAVRANVLRSNCSGTVAR